ncbi:MAG: succinate dehydrogenase, hydrophobic membrane anchor protein [Zetaproteobacteria bacterium]|nr:succinate dehydrogenase, hydrophobic membrane anchor protein [Zetaproteobacteria bacterium]
MALKRTLNNPHSGMHEWLWQRISALVLLFILPTTLFILIAIRDGLIPYTLFQQAEMPTGTLYTPWLSIILSLAILAFMIHGAIGIKAITDDYLHTPMRRRLASTFLLITTVAITLLLLSIVWQIGV